MVRRSGRGKTKPTPETDESPDKQSKSSRHSRRRKKSSSSSENEGETPQKNVESISQPQEIKVQDIELPQEKKSDAIAGKVVEPKTADDSKNDWKEDKAFWEPEQSKVIPVSDASTSEVTSQDKEESSLWKIQSANGKGGEIQKLKICRQKPTESPEIAESSLRKRLGKTGKDGRSTDDSTQEESEKDTKKSKHRSRTSSRNSPLISPTVVCDISEGSPTKIKIINVGHLSTENKESTKVVCDNNEQVKDNNSPREKSKIVEPDEVKDIANNPNMENPKDVEIKEAIEKINIPNLTSVSNIPEPSKCSIQEDKKPETLEQNVNLQKLPSPKASSNKEDVLDSIKSRTSRSSNDSESSDGESKLRKRVKKKRRGGLQSTIQRSASPKQESSDSEEDHTVKNEADQRDTGKSTKIKKETTSMDYEGDNSSTTQENCVLSKEKDKTEPLSEPKPRKRRWGSSKSNRPEKKPVLLSTASLKSLIPDVKPVPAEELQLSVDEEEGQLDDDDEEDEVVVLLAKEEEKAFIEEERHKEDRHKEERIKEKLKEKENEEESNILGNNRHITGVGAILQRIKPDYKKETTEFAEKNSVGATRKIRLLSDDAKKLKRTPSPPRRKQSNVLFITNLVRPFTVQQLKNLLLRTGVITENGFWIDKIKSKCYVEYSTEDQAFETRHALHGVRWPTSNPKTLIVEFSSKGDLEMALALSEEPELPRKAEPLTMVEGWVADQQRMKDKTRKTVVREWDVGKPAHPDEALEQDLKKEKKEKEREQERKSRKEREHHRRSRTPDEEPPVRKSRKKEEDAPAKLLDDLFRKTKTSPCIYWLPLTPEQIAVKEEIRRQHMAAWKMAEERKAEQAKREKERRRK